MISHRRHFFALALMAIAITGKAKADEENDLAKSASILFGQIASKAGSAISFENGQVISGNKRIRVTAVSENVLKQAGRFISAARFEISIDDTKRPELTFGSIGIGDSGADASQTAVTEWYLLAGRALFAGIGGQPPDIRADDLSIYVGLMGIRGERPEGWLDGTTKMNQQIIEVLRKHLPAAGVLSAIDLKMMVKANASIEGQCMIDGKESVDAIADLKSLPWPATKDSYMFKQAYVVARK
jgi:hypothetical protein